MATAIAGFGHQKCFVEEILTPVSQWHRCVQLLLQWAAWRGPVSHLWSAIMQVLLSSLLSGLELSETKHASPAPLHVALLEPVCHRFIAIGCSRHRVHHRCGQGSGHSRRWKGHSWLQERPCRWCNRVDCSKKLLQCSQHHSSELAQQRSHRNMCATDKVVCTTSTAALPAGVTTLTFTSGAVTAGLLQAATTFNAHTTSAVPAVAQQE